jgi:signal peptidase I
LDRLDPTGGVPVAGAYADPPLQEVSTATWKDRRSILWEWAGAVVLALIAALLIRALFFEAFRIPSESMENTLQVGDFVLVSKLHYGARLPITLGLPFTKLYLADLRLPYMRLPGFAAVSRGDVVVFNVPTEDGAVDRKTHYIKRVVGLPGDTLSILNKIPHAGGTTLPLRPEMKQRWRVYPAEGQAIPIDRLARLGVAQFAPPERRDDPVDFEGTAAVAAQIAQWAEIRDVRSLVRGHGLQTRVFPADRGFTLDNYGPLYIPSAGDTLHLTEESWPVYGALLTRFENPPVVRLGEDRFAVEGQPASTYVVGQDYYFVMGDNRDSSLDSRTWGFVPGDHLVGKAVAIYFSWDPYQKRARLERIPRLID